MKHIAVILAAGKGSRMGTDVPKQFITIGGKTILEYSLDTFEAHEGIDEIAVVVDETQRARVADIVEQRLYRKVRHILRGGTERYLSTRAAIEAYAGAGSACALLIHDAARPLVSAALISSCLAALQTHAAVIVAVPTTDTIIECSASGVLQRIPPRQQLLHVQTPQGFHLSTLAAAFARASHDSTCAPPDDCSVVHRYLPAVEIQIVAGDERNIKITYNSDLEHLKTLLAAH